MQGSILDSSFIQVNLFYILNTGDPLNYLSSSDLIRGSLGASGDPSVKHEDDTSVRDFIFLSMHHLA
jgi:hypothetical protein